MPKKQSAPQRRRSRTHWPSCIAVWIEPIILASIEFAAYSTRVQPAVIKPAMRPRDLPAGFIAPCLPTSAPEPPSGAVWLHEIKHDGFRVIARKEGERVKLYSRPGNDLTWRFPLIVEAVAKLRSRSCSSMGRPWHVEKTGSHRSIASDTDGVT